MTINHVVSSSEISWCSTSFLAVHALAQTLNFSLKNDGISRWKSQTYWYNKSKIGPNAKRIALNYLQIAVLNDQKVFQKTTQNSTLITFDQKIHKILNTIQSNGWKIHHIFDPASYKSPFKLHLKQLKIACKKDRIAFKIGSKCAHVKKSVHIYLHLINKHLNISNSINAFFLLKIDHRWSWFVNSS